MRRGTNLPRMGGYNQMVVIDEIRRAPDGVSRVELAGLTGLSLQTISNICGRLLTDGVIVEGEKRSEGLGKPRTMLHLEPSAGYALGVHVDPVAMTIIVVDLDGEILEKRVVETPVGAENAIAAIVTTAEDLLDRSGILRSKVLGMGVAVPGPIDMDTGRVVRPPLLVGWDDVPLRDALGEALDMPVLLEKDVSAAMIAEMWQEVRLARGTAIFFYMGFGVAVAFAHGGELLAGSSRNAGEVGHLIVDGDGPLCSCGNRGCIGVSSSPMTFVDEAISRGILPETTVVAIPADVDRALTVLCAAAEGGDERAIDIIETSARRVAHGITILTDLVDADIVAFGGPCWSRLQGRFLPAVREELATRATLREMHPVEILGSTVGEHVGAVGAASLVLDDAFTPRPSGLLAGARRS
ncbi:Sugar kinase of the NBD/HSP70 family, may contain an N-terminal HTH domain [Sanguibacter gelidistatuariae]|uniref:Sugar kinase of the NBD/HSP70 family, may contain an N-terminal HTH domain n=1 Tax=Sanguibacter gelidistatuariae TaxID=1814289 RepID=A0A1G6KVE9_9MICO|nr:ROK family protein [Sanguibacter gelidistatuariae]SDC34798.1 Sugar kinase of the NBD/HSP70 family, may contain an N-terminal HTH domain [Sanguibacter gelidistatuariae]